MVAVPTTVSAPPIEISRSWSLAEGLLFVEPMRTAILATTLLAACGASPAGDGDAFPGPGTPDNPVPTDEGPYAVANTVDFTVEQIVPEQVELVVATLRDFSENPATALIKAAERAGVPEATTIYGLIPSPLRGKFEGFINDEVAKAKVGGRPLTEYAGDFAMLFELALTSFQVDSEMTLDGHAVDHRLTALDLHPAGIDFRLPIGGLAGDVLTQHPDIEVAEGGAIYFGEQHFGLNYGEYAWQALDAFSVQAFGADIKTTFQNAVDCQHLAESIANKCVLGVCVGHETTIRDVCNGGVGAIVDFVHAEIAKHRIEALHFASGAARLVDTDGDGAADTIVDGVWDAEMNFGLGLRHTDAVFAGAR